MSAQSKHIVNQLQIATRVSQSTLQKPNQDDTFYFCFSRSNVLVYDTVQSVLVVVATTSSFIP